MTADSKCGTYAGFQAHRKAGESVCEPCRQARNDYMSAWRRHTKSPSELRRREIAKAWGRARERLVAAHREEYERYLDEEMAGIEQRAAS